MSRGLEELGYAGELTVDEAWDRLFDGDAVLVDVRTEQEWEVVGRPTTLGTGSEVRFVQWNRDGGVRNEDFLEEIEELRGSELLFLCRSGVRSHHAALAATAAGHTAFNVLGGFEGAEGWRVSGLPVVVR